MMTDTANNLDAALKLARSGFSVFPCQSGGDKAKRPMPFIKWRDASTSDERQVMAWWSKWPDAAIGLDLAKSGLIVIDADRHDEHDGVTAFGQLMGEHGFHPDTAPLVATPNEGNHFFFRQPPGKQFGNGEGALPDGINVRGHGGYVIAPGTTMADGRFYELWGELDAAPILPDWLATIIETPRGNRQQSQSEQGFQPKYEARGNQPAGEEIEDLLAHIPPDIGYTDWVSVLMAIHAATDGKGLGLADAWSARGSKYKGRREIEAKWRSFRREGVTIGTLAQIARDHGADLSAIALKHNRPEGYDPIEAAAAARRLIEHHDGTIMDAETGEIVEERPIEAKVPALEFPPGLVGDIARWIVETSRRPQPELSIGAALAIVGTVAGRQFAGPTMSGTHLYILGLAPTGTGKDHPLQQIGRIMAAAKLGLHLGPSEFISMPALVNFIMRKPLSVCPMDEFGAFMKRINSRRASGFESAISKIIRTLWSSSFAPYSTPEWAQKESMMVYSPSITLYGASTPEQFYSAMESASVEDGTLNRFLLLNGRDRAVEQEPGSEATVVPDTITDRIQSIYNRSGPMASSYRNDPNADPAMAGHVREFKWCPDGAQERYRAFSSEIEATVRNQGEHGAFYARTVEMALRIATIVAIGRLEDDQVRLGDLEYGINLATASAEMMVAGAADYMAENENQANAQKVMRIVKARGGRVKHRDIVVSMKHTMKARDLRDLLGAMCEAGQLQRQEQTPQGGGHPIYYYQIP